METLLLPPVLEKHARGMLHEFLDINRNHVMLVRVETVEHKPQLDSTRNPATFPPSHHDEGSI